MAVAGGRPAKPESPRLCRVRMGTGGLWPAGLAGCTGLQVPRLESDSAAPMPDGPYLDRLQKLSWLCHRSAAVPEALRAATALEQLHLTTDPERVATSRVLDSLPNIQRLDFDRCGRLATPRPAEALLELERRLSTKISYW